MIYVLYSTYVILLSSLISASLIVLIMSLSARAREWMKSIGFFKLQLTFTV